MILILDICAFTILHTIFTLITPDFILFRSWVNDEVEYSEHDEQICGVSQVEDNWFDEGPAENLLGGGEAYSDINSRPYSQNHQVVHEE